MASRLPTLAPSLSRALASRASSTSAGLITLSARRAFHPARSLLNDAATTSSSNIAAAAAPAAGRRPVGAFRGGLLGFLAGTSVAAYGTYYYVLEEYRLANELLVEDIYALQAAVQRIHDYVATLERKVESMERRR